MEDVLGLRGAENHPPPAALVSAKSARDERVTAGFRFITYSADIRQILDHIGADAEPPRITPARGPPLWDGCDAQMGDGVDGVDVEPDWDEAAQQAPDFEADQRVSW